MVTKRVIRLTESELHAIVRECTEQVLLEEGAFSKFGRGLKSLIGAGIDAAGQGNKIRQAEKDHPTLAKIGQFLGMDSEDEKDKERLNYVGNWIRRHVSRNYGNQLATAFNELNNRICGMIYDGSSQVKDGFETLGDAGSLNGNGNGSIPPMLYNSCAEVVKSIINFFEKWSNPNPNKVQEIRPMEFMGYSSSPKRDRARVQSEYGSDWNDIKQAYLNFQGIADQCYRDITANYGQDKNINQQALTKYVSGFIRDIKYIRSLMNNIDSTWFGVAPQQAQQQAQQQQTQQPQQQAQQPTQAQQPQQPQTSQYNGGNWNYTVTF